jgi:hypothetical protein
MDNSILKDIFQEGEVPIRKLTGDTDDELVVTKDLSLLTSFS